MLQRHWLICCLVLVLGFVCGLSDAEELTIVQLYKYHASYQLHSVSIIGTVRAMHVFPPLSVFDSDRCSCPPQKLNQATAAANEYS